MAFKINGGRGDGRPEEKEPEDRTFPLPWDAFVPSPGIIGGRGAGRPEERPEPIPEPTGWWDYERPQDITREAPPAPVFWTPALQRTIGCLPVIPEPDWGAGGDWTLANLEERREWPEEHICRVAHDVWFGSTGRKYSDLKDQLYWEVTHPWHPDLRHGTAFGRWWWLLWGGDSELARQGIGTVAQAYGHPSLDPMSVQGELDAINEQRLQQGFEPVLAEDYAKFQRYGQSPVYAALAQAKYDQARSEGKSGWASAWETLTTLYGDAVADISWDEAQGFRYTHLKDWEAAMEYRALRDQGYSPLEAGKATENPKTELLGLILINPSLVCPSVADVLGMPLKPISKYIAKPLWSATGEPIKEAIVRLPIWTQLTDPAKVLLARATGPLKSAAEWLRELTVSSKINVATGRARHLGDFLEWQTGGRVVGDDMVALILDQTAEVYTKLPRWVQTEWDELLDLVDGNQLRIVFKGLDATGVAGDLLAESASSAARKLYGRGVGELAAGVWSRRVRTVRDFMVESWLFSRPAWVAYNFVGNLQHFFLEGVNPIRSWRMIDEFEAIIGPMPADMRVGFAAAYRKTFRLLDKDTLSEAASDMAVVKLLGGVGRPLGLWQAFWQHLNEGIERSARSSLFVGQFQKHMDEVFGAWVRLMPDEAFAGVPSQLVDPLRRYLSRRVATGFMSSEMMDKTLQQFGEGATKVTWNRLTDFRRSRDLLPDWMSEGVVKKLDELVETGAPIGKADVKEVFEEVRIKMQMAEIEEVRHLHTALDDLHVAVTAGDLMDDAMRVGGELKTRQGFLDAFEECERQYAAFLHWAGQELVVTIDAQVTLGKFTTENWEQILADHRVLVAKQTSNINLIEEELLIRVCKKWDVDVPKEFMQDRAMLRADLAAYFELKDEIFGKASYQAGVLVRAGQRGKAGLVWERARKEVQALGGAKVDTEMALAQNYQAAFRWANGLTQVEAGPATGDLIFANRREVNEILHDILEKAPEVHNKYAPHYKELDRWLEEVLAKRLTPQQTLKLTVDQQEAVSRAYSQIRRQFTDANNGAWDFAYERTNKALMNYTQTSRTGNFMRKIFPFWRWPSSNIPYWVERVMHTPAGRWAGLAILDAHRAVGDWNTANGLPPSMKYTLPVPGSKLPGVSQFLKASGISDGIHAPRFDPFRFITIMSQFPSTPYKMQELQDMFIGEEGNLDLSKASRGQQIATMLDSVGLYSWPYIDYGLGISGVLGEDWYSRDFIPWSRAIEYALYSVSDGKWDFNPDRELRKGINALAEYFPFIKGHELFTDRWLLYEAGKEMKRMVMEGTAEIDAEGNYLDPEAVQKEAHYRALKREAATSVFGHLSSFYLKDYHDADARAYALQSAYREIKEKGDYPAETHEAAEARDHFFLEHPEIFALWEASGRYPWVAKMSDFQRAQMEQFEYNQRDWYWDERNAINAHYDAELDAALMRNLADWTTKTLVNASRAVALDGLMAEYQTNLSGQANELEIEGYGDVDNLTPFRVSLWGKTPDDVERSFQEQTFRTLFEHMPQKVDYTTVTPNGKVVYDGDAYRTAMDYFWGNPLEVLKQTPLWFPNEVYGTAWFDKNITEETFDEYSRRNDSMLEALQKVYYDYFIQRGSDEYQRFKVRRDAGELTDEEWNEGLDELFAGFENIPISEVMPFVYVSYSGRWTPKELLDFYEGGEYVLPSLTEWWGANDTARETTISRLKELYLSLGSLDRKKFRKAYPDFSEDLWEDPEGTTTNRFMAYIHGIEDALDLPHSVITDAPVWSDEFSARAGGDKVDVTDPSRALRVDIYSPVIDEKAAITDVVTEETTTVTDPELRFALANPEDAEEYEAAKLANDRAWELKEAGEHEAAQELFEDPLWIKWFGQTPKSLFWRYYLNSIPPGLISEDVRADMLVQAILDAESSREYVSEDGYEAALARLTVWTDTRPDLPGHPAEWAVAKDEMNAYMELEKGSDERAEYWTSHSLLDKYWGAGAGAARSLFWDMYLNQIPPGRISEALRANPLIAAILAKEEAREYVTDEGYEVALYKMKAWLESRPDLPGDLEEWTLAKEQIGEYMELEKGSDARKEYWAAHPLLELYWGEGSGGTTAAATWTKTAAKNTATATKKAATGTSTKVAPRASQTEVWMDVQVSLGPLGLGQLSMHIYQGKKLSSTLQSKLRTLYNRYGAGWTTFNTWVREYLRYLLKSRAQFREPKLGQPRHNRLSIGKMGYTGTTPRSFIRR